MIVQLDLRAAQNIWATMKRFQLFSEKKKMSISDFKIDKKYFRITITIIHYKMQPRDLDKGVEMISGCA